MIYHLPISYSAIIVVYHIVTPPLNHRDKIEYYFFRFCYRCFLLLQVLLVWYQWYHFLFSRIFDIIFNNSAWGLFKSTFSMRRVQRWKIYESAESESGFLMEDSHVEENYERGTSIRQIHRCSLLLRWNCKVLTGCLLSFLFSFASFVSRHSARHMDSQKRENERAAHFISRFKIKKEKERDGNYRGNAR